MRTIMDSVAAYRRIGPNAAGFGRKLLSMSLDLLLHWMELRRQRRALQTLDDRLLKDVGLSRADVDRETSKPFWRF